ncbi:E4 ORF1 [Squirrel monkey adenovirus]|nr:E4 ORF1 [Squirrel monkey adenovirus]
MAFPRPGLLVQRLEESVSLPVHHPGTGVYDLFAPTDFTVYAGGCTLLYSNLSVRVPVGYVGHISSCQPLVTGHGVYAVADRVPCNLEAELKILLCNTSCHTYRGHKGDPVARLVLQGTDYPPVVEITEL